METDTGQIEFDKKYKQTLLLVFEMFQLSQ